MMTVVRGLAGALVDIRTDSEDDRKKELELLPGHSLEVHRVVIRLDTKALALDIVSINVEKIEERNLTLWNG